LERRKFGATRRPTKAPRRTASRRHIPAAVKRAVWRRDGGTCGFVSESGRRCGSNRRLEFDHVNPVARGGGSSVDNLRLRCRAHNLYAAEQAFGAGFMQQKRAAAARQKAAAQSAHAPQDRDVTPWLRQLGLRATQARHLAALCDEVLPDAPLEARVRFALQRQGAHPPF
jgi:5-methylcytosine-specific restriction endonuclease McrA